MAGHRRVRRSSAACTRGVSTVTPESRYPGVTVGPATTISPRSPLSTGLPFATTVTRTPYSGCPTDPGRSRAPAGRAVATCEAASVSPYVGWTGTPAASVRSSNRSGVGAPPTSTVDSSASGAPVSSNRRNCVGTSETPVTPCVVSASPVRSTSNARWTTSVVPYIAVLTTGASPPTWLTGRQHSHRSPGDTPRRNADATALACRFPAVRRTPFALPVVPEVNRITAVSAGSSGPEPAAVAPFSNPPPLAAMSVSPSRSPPAGGSRTATACVPTGSGTVVRGPATRQSTVARRTCADRSAPPSRLSSPTTVQPSRCAAWNVTTNAGPGLNSVPTRSTADARSCRRSTVRSTSTSRWRYDHRRSSRASTSAVRSGVAATRSASTSIGSRYGERTQSRCGPVLRAASSVRVQAPVARGSRHPRRARRRAPGRGRPGHRSPARRDRPRGCSPRRGRPRSERRRR